MIQNILGFLVTLGLLSFGITCLFTGLTIVIAFCVALGQGAIWFLRQQWVRQALAMIAVLTCISAIWYGMVMAKNEYEQDRQTIHRSSTPTPWHADGTAYGKAGIIGKDK